MWNESNNDLMNSFTLSPLLALNGPCVCIHIMIERTEC